MRSEAPTRSYCTSDTGSVRWVPAQIYTEKFLRVAELAARGQSLSGDCADPVHVLFYARQADGPSAVKDMVTCHQSVRCRKCPECRAHSARCWMARSCAEVEAAPRTWFATLTFDWRRAPMEGVSEQWKYAGRALTLFLKRLRKRGCQFRYLAVFEAHKSGRPHIHLLLHEKQLNSVRWKAVDEEWKANGFHKTNLVSDPRVAGYATKYLFKDGGLCRVRASLRYGGRADMDRCLTPFGQASAEKQCVKTSSHPKDERSLPLSSRIFPSEVEKLEKFTPGSLWRKLWRMRED